MLSGWRCGGCESVQEGLHRLLLKWQQRSINHKKRIHWHAIVLDAGSWKLVQMCKIKFYGGSLLWKKWLNCKESCENAENGFFRCKSEMASLTAGLRSSRGRIKYRRNDLKFCVQSPFALKNWMDIGTSCPQNFRSAYWTGAFDLKQGRCLAPQRPVTLDKGLCP